jgi:GT2 family glycosyltransferase
MLSIVIPTYNGRRHLERCLPSVCRHAPPGTQILVVDDASSDGTAAWVHDSFPEVELIVMPVNQGFVMAVNAGIRRACGDVIELLNNDTEVCAGWAEPCLRWFADPTIGSVAPLVLQMQRPTFIDSAGTEYHLCGWAFNRGFNREMQAAYESPVEVFGPSGSAGFYRRTALEKTGLLLPELGAYFEDIDLAFRLRRVGYRSMYEPAGRVLHQGSASYGQESNRVTRLIARNEELIFWTNLPPSKLILGLAPHFGFFAVRLLRKLFSRKLFPFLAGKWEALTSWRNVMRRRQQLRQQTPTGPQRIDLHLSHSAAVVGRGLKWLRRRQCA